MANLPDIDPPITTPPLTPMSLGDLVGRIEHEWATRHKIFDLPSARIWAPEPDIDLSFEFLGRPCATPIGPAAGPHSQLAENIVLAWLGGSRLIELKTVQVLDDLVINRPCIDMETIGYNIEWSQELTVPQSLTEYVKASMLIEMLSRWEPLAEHVKNSDGVGPGRHIFDMSVGYDLAGIKSDKVATFLRSMRDASDVVASLRAELAQSATGFAAFAEHDFDTLISDTLTLSTFHGCPPDEIEAIVTHLIDDYQLDVIVKLNPTLLGYETVRHLVNDVLGYHDVEVQESAFAADLQFDRGVDLIGGLADYAAARGRKFGIKLTNTLVVNNRRGVLPDPTMYLSGAPLHVLASTLLERLDTALPGRLALPGQASHTGRPDTGDIMVSFSAGVCKENLADTLATGVNPATVCSDLLKPGGYGRLSPMLRALAATMREDGAKNLIDWRATRQERAVAAGFMSACAQHASDCVGATANLYDYANNSKLPRAVDNDLVMFDCVACNFCITVCPNDAFFSIPSIEGQSARQQYFVLAELCNECGNCMTFCPERGDPAAVKPRLFVNKNVFDGRDGQGFLIEGGRVVDARCEPEQLATLVRLTETTLGLPLAEQA